MASSAQIELWQAEKVAAQVAATQAPKRPLRDALVALVGGAPCLWPA